ncbi:class I SAM-dependent methyltransferase [Microbacterium sp.]|uniref:class I SAM-dependent methyltransferase n=1 Tax=Microbacterium sp. TaxID=51671 RepID=UPI003A882F01
MSLRRVQNAYAARAGEYAEQLGHMGAVAEPDRRLVLGWATGLTGPVVDVGCGPGHWTAYLHDHGVDVSGVDPVPEFVAHARDAHPAVTFRPGTAERLYAADGELGGVLAWYSLIRHASDRVPAVLAEFARVLRPGGGLLLGFFEGPASERFDHAVITAYRWPVDALTTLVEDAGFAVTSTQTRTDPGARPHGAITATRHPG